MSTFLYERMSTLLLRYAWRIFLSCLKTTSSFVGLRSTVLCTGTLMKEPRFCLMGPDLKCVMADIYFRAKSQGTFTACQHMIYVV